MKLEKGCLMLTSDDFDCMQDIVNSGLSIERLFRDYLAKHNINFDKIYTVQISAGVMLGYNELACNILRLFPKFK